MARPRTSNAVLWLLFLSVAVSHGMEYPGNRRAVKAEETTFCYSCSSESVLCQHSVYDGQYLSEEVCSSSCFLRVEGNTTYRGCFDGWTGSMVHGDYEGCQMQQYYGKRVLWCFCKGKPGRHESPCNGASQNALAKTADGNYGQHVVSAPPLPRQQVEQPPHARQRQIYDNYGYSYVAEDSYDNVDKTSSLRVRNENKIDYSRYDPRQPKSGLGSGRTAKAIRQDGKMSRLQYNDHQASTSDVPQKQQNHPRDSLKNEVRDKGKNNREMKAAHEASAKMAADAFQMAERRSNAADTVSGGDDKHAKMAASSEEPCTYDMEGTFQDPDDCTRYFLCSNGHPFHMRCPFGTQWSQHLRACAFSFHPMYPCKMEDLMNSRPKHLSMAREEAVYLDDNYN